MRHQSPKGDGAHCDKRLLVKPEIVISLTSNTSPSFYGDATAEGACLHAPKSVRKSERISIEHGFVEKSRSPSYNSIGTGKSYILILTSTFGSSTVVNPVSPSPLNHCKYRG